MQVLEEQEERLLSIKKKGTNRLKRQGYSSIFGQLFENKGWGRVGSIGWTVSRNGPFEHLLPCVREKEK